MFNRWHENLGGLSVYKTEHYLITVTGPLAPKMHYEYTVTQFLREAGWTVAVGESSTLQRTKTKAMRALNRHEKRGRK
jgi:hypothetical protein